MAKSTSIEVGYILNVSCLIDRPNGLALVCCFCLISLFSRNVSGMDDLESLIVARKTISTLHVEGNSSLSSGASFEFKVWMSGGENRTDVTRLAFPTDPAQVGIHDRSVLAKGQRIRVYRGRTPTIDPPDSNINYFVNAKLMGLDPMKLEFLDLGRGIDSTVAGWMLTLNREEFGADAVPDGEFPYAVTGWSAKQGSLEYRVYFGVRGTYLGCSVRDGQYYNRVEVSTNADLLPVEFPKEFRSIMIRGDTVEFDEVVKVSVVEINQPIDDSLFTLSGMGVPEGQQVTVRDGSLGGSDFELGILIDGQVVKKKEKASGPVAEIRKPPSTSRWILLAGNFILVGSVLLYFGLRRFS